MSGRIRGRVLEGLAKVFELTRRAVGTAEVFRWNACLEMRREQALKIKNMLVEPLRSLLALRP